MTIVDRRDESGRMFMVRTKKGVPIDDLYQPLKQTKRRIVISNIPIPAGSYIAYVVSDGGAFHSVFSRKTQAMSDYRSGKRVCNELNILETYLTPEGEFIDSVVVK
jgi:hypothetical protein